MFVRLEATDPPRRPRRVLRGGRAAGQPRAPRTAGARRRRGVVPAPSYEAAGPASTRRWARVTRFGSARTRSSSPGRHGGLLRGEQGRLQSLRGYDADRRRASIDEAFLDVRGIESPRRQSHSRSRAPEAKRPHASGCRSPSASRGRSSWPRSRARSPSPTGCSPCRPRASSSSSPLPVERLWGVGRVTARGSTTQASVRWARSPSSPSLRS